MPQGETLLPHGAVTTLWYNFGHDFDIAPGPPPPPPPGERGEQSLFPRKFRIITSMITVTFCICEKMALYVGPERADARICQRVVRNAVVRLPPIHSSCRLWSIPAETPRVPSVHFEAENRLRINKDTLCDHAHVPRN